MKIKEKIKIWKSVFLCATVTGLILESVLPAYSSMVLPSRVSIGSINSNNFVLFYDDDGTTVSYIILQNADASTIFQFYVDCGSEMIVTAYAISAIHYNRYEFKTYATNDETGSFDCTQAPSYDLANPIYSGYGDPADGVNPVDRTGRADLYTNRSIFYVRGCIKSLNSLTQFRSESI